MVEVSQLTRTYGEGTTAVHAVAGADFTIPTGQLVALVGRSGSGKTTLLNCIGGLDRPTSGTVRIGGDAVTSMGEKQLARMRRDVVAFVFQTFGLVPVLSAAENVGLPLRLRATPSGQREERVAMLLEMVGLSGHAAQRPAEMSGGQQQRVAIARALANGPRLLIADEPTGQLDHETGRAVMNLLQAVVRAESMTAIISTHDPALMEVADRVIRLADGHVIEDSTVDR